MPHVDVLLLSIFLKRSHRHLMFSNKRCFYGKKKNNIFHNINNLHNLHFNKIKSYIVYIKNDKCKFLKKLKMYFGFDFRISKIKSVSISINFEDYDNSLSNDISFLSNNVFIDGLLQKEVLNRISGLDYEGTEFVYKYNNGLYFFNNQHLMYKFETLYIIDTQYFNIVYKNINLEFICVFFIRTFNYDRDHITKDYIINLLEGYALFKNNLSTFTMDEQHNINLFIEDYIRDNFNLDLELNFLKRINDSNDLSKKKINSLLKTNDLTLFFYNK